MLTTARRAAGQYAPPFPVTSCGNQRTASRLDSASGLPNPLSRITRAQFSPGCAHFLCGAVVRAERIEKSATKAAPA
jgi:hypothetical protein